MRGATVKRYDLVLDGLADVVILNTDVPRAGTVQPIPRKRNCALVVSVEDSRPGELTTGEFTNQRPEPHELTARVRHSNTLSLG